MSRPKASAANPRRSHSSSVLARVADAYDIPLRLLESAVAVREYGVPELGALIDAGEIKIDPAEIVARSLSHEEQRALIAKGPAAVKAEAARLRAAKRGRPLPAAARKHVVQLLLLVDELALLLQGTDDQEVATVLEECQAHRAELVGIGGLKDDLDAHHRALMALVRQAADSRQPQEEEP